jgi:hypothetical protein
MTSMAPLSVAAFFFRSMAMSSFALVSEKDWV